MQAPFYSLSQGAYISWQLDRTYTISFEFNLLFLNWLFALGFHGLHVIVLMY